MAIDAMHAGTTSTFGATGFEDAAFDVAAGSDAGDAISDRLAAAASDYEAIDSESLAGLGPGD